MESKSIGCKEGIDWNLIQERFPQIALLLCYSSHEKILCFYDEKGWLQGEGPRGLLYGNNAQLEVQQWKASLSLEGVDVLYIYGIGLGHLYGELQNWLHEKLERKLVFFEEEIAVLEALFSEEVGSAIARDLQVFVYYTPDDESYVAAVEECLHNFSCDRIEWTSLPSYRKGREKKMQRLRLKLLRRSSSIHAFADEQTHYHQLLANIAPNLLQLPHSFHANNWKGKFAKVPAIICGAGYSLAQNKELLEQLEQKALIIAGGSAITALGHYGIRPHITVAVDPNEEEYSRLKTSSSFEIPLMYASRLHKDILPSMHVQQGYVCCHTGGVFEAWAHEKLSIDSPSFALHLGQEALSVTTLATAFAVELGCDPIIFCGVDLAYARKQRYCPGVVAASTPVSWKDLDAVKRSRDRVVRRKNSAKQFVFTLVKWVMEASCLGSYAKKNPLHRFLNLSQIGLPIPSAPIVSPEEVLENYCMHSFDLRGILHTEVQNTMFAQDAKEIMEASFQEMKESLQVSIPMIEEMLREIEKELIDDRLSIPSGKRAVLEIDFAEQPAYYGCLQGIITGYQRLFTWSHPSSCDISSQEKRRQFLEKERKLWSVTAKAAEECLKILQNC